MGKLSRKKMWESIEEMSKTLRPDVIAKQIVSLLDEDTKGDWAEARLTAAIWRWLRSKRKKKAPEQLAFFWHEDGIKTYDSLDAVPEPLLRKRSRKLRELIERLTKIVDAIDEHLKKRAAKADRA